MRVDTDETSADAALEEYKDVEIEIQNRDDGDRYLFNVKGHERLESVIVELYRDKLHRDQLDLDRLQCKATGEDVLQYAGMTWDAYLKAGHCSGLVWLFSGPTGGA
jgi:hypothetical protein